MSETLAGSKSPFLQHGAEQPVRWMPWGDAAFERARREDKPILLDIGAVWCHWCHVMDRESYENGETAALINELYVPIKVDRDERPDVDTRYQRAVQTLTGQGGWPLTAFLTPDGQTFYGGTYFPPVDSHGRPSFRRVLGEVARIWKDDRERALDAVRGITERLNAYAQAEAQSGSVDARLINETVEELANSFDFRYGGFGRAPKFPSAGALLLLIDHDLDTGTGWSRRMALETLTAMGKGGIYDQLGGGFHRYSVDARWIIPHFEKMAYDNGPLLEAFARAFAVYGDDELTRVSRGIVDYYHDVAAPLVQQGGFPASQDADYSPDDDGDYWTWTAAEIEEALPDRLESELALNYYGVNEPASSMHLDASRHVLFVAQPIERVAKQLGSAESHVNDVLSSVRKKLKRVRDARPQPFVDETVYTGWTGLVASGFLAAARHLDHEQAAVAARKALDRIWVEGYSEAGLTHRLGDANGIQHLDDYAHVAQALLDEYEYTQDATALTRAQTLLDRVEMDFLDAGKGAYRDRPVRATAPTSVLDQPSYSIADAPVPAGNSVIALSLLRFAGFTNRELYRTRAMRILRAFAGAAARMTSSAATYVRALAWMTQPTTSIVIVGRGKPLEDRLFRAALRSYRPRTTLRWLDTAEADRAELQPEIAAMLTGDAPRAYVCMGNACMAPIADADVLTAALRGNETAA